VKLFLIILCNFTALMPLLVSAEYYKYIDKNGNVSFTDNIVNVPEDQRQNAETRGNRLDSKDKILDDRRRQGKLPLKLSVKDLDLVKRLKEAGLIDGKIEQEMTPEKIQELKIMLKLSYGIEEDDIGKKDSRFSSPEGTWSVHKQAIMDGDLEKALTCFIPKSAEDYRKGYQGLGKEKMRSLASEMNPIERITQNGEYAKYRIIRQLNGKDITFYIYFVNVLGNWKIQQF
jgi:hypothetical protein